MIEIYLQDDIESYQLYPDIKSGMDVLNGTSLPKKKIFESDRSYKERLRQNMLDAINLLGEVSPQQAPQALEYLRQLYQEKIYNVNTIILDDKGRKIETESRERHAFFNAPELLKPYLNFEVVMDVSPGNNPYILSRRPKADIEFDRMKALENPVHLLFIHTISILEQTISANPLDL